MHGAEVVAEWVCSMQVPTQSIANWVEGLSFASMREESKSKGDSFHIYYGREINRYDHKNVKRPISFNFL